ncbi:MAG: hypothetical protein AAGB02_03270 [Pseudomonadota bacterium]
MLRYLLFAPLLYLFACGQEIAAPDDSATPAVEIPASDSLPGLPAVPSAIDIWIHPALPFNSMVLVTDKSGARSYNAEDGNPVAELSAAPIGAAAVGYFGAGPQAVGVLVAHIADEQAVRLFEIDNVSRRFKPIEGRIPVRGEVRDICIGAGDGGNLRLHILQKADLFRYDLALEAGQISASGSPAIRLDNDIGACVIDIVTGNLFLASEGDIFAFDMAGEAIESFVSLGFSRAPGLGLIIQNTEDPASPRRSAVVAADISTGAFHFYDATDGHALGAVKMAATDELAGVETIFNFSVSGSNLGGLYRNGAIIVATNPTGENAVASLRFAPTASAFNALSLPLGTPFDPRGSVPNPDADSEDLEFLIPTTFQPE